MRITTILSSERGIRDLSVRLHRSNSTASQGVVGDSTPLLHHGCTSMGSSTLGLRHYHMETVQQGELYV